MRQRRGLRVTETGEEVGRRARSKARILKETYRQLSASGIGGVSVDEIARRAGVSKATIYRHWPSRSALLMDACASLGAPLATPRTGGLRGDLTGVLTALAGQLETAPWSAVYPSILDAAERDPDVAALQSALHAVYMKTFEEVLARHPREAPPDKLGGSPAERVARLVGPLFFMRWFERRPITAALIDSIVSGALD